MDRIWCIEIIIINLSLVVLKSCQAQPGCPTDLPHTTLVTSYNGKCYQYVSDEKTWRSARDYCWQHGGSLVILNDEQTNRFVTQKLDSITAWSNSAVWIGLNDEEDSDYWKWVTSDPDVSIDMTWSNWGGDHPTKGFFAALEGDCIRIKRKDGWKWHESNCYMIHRTYRFICEYEQDMATTAEPEHLRLAAVLQVGKIKSIITTNTDHITTEQAVEDSGAYGSAVGTEMLKTYMMYTVITGLSLLLIIIIILFAYYTLRRRSNKRKNYAPPTYSESIYEDITVPGSGISLTKSGFTPMQTTAMQTSEIREHGWEIRENRLSNIYVEPDMQTSKSDAFDDVSGNRENDAVIQKFDTDGYMEPKKLMTESQLSDTYLTVTPLGSPTDAKLKPITSQNTHEVPKTVEFHDYANKESVKNRKLPDLPNDYLPMRGSREVLVCDENSKSVPSPSSSKEETIEQMYSVI